MDKYIQLINKLKLDREYVENFLAVNNIQYVSLDINGNCAQLRLDSIGRFKLEIIKNEFSEHLKVKGLRFKLI